MLEREDVSRKIAQSGLNQLSLAHLLLTWPDHPDRSACISEHCIPPGGAVKMYNYSSDSETEVDKSKQLCDIERHFDLITHIVIDSSHPTWDDIIVSPVPGFPPSFCTYLQHELHNCFFF